MSHSSNYKKLEYRNFQQIVYVEKKPVVIVFEAEWSGNARIMQSMIQRISDDCKRNLYYYHVNIDKEKELVDLFNVTEVPTTIFIAKGEMVEFITGMIPSSTMRIKLDAFCESLD